MTVTDNGKRPRTLPHDLEAERGLLGAMMLSRDAIIATAGTVDAGSFYRPAHGHIHHAITELDGRGEPCDPVTIADQLTSQGLLDQAGGIAGLIDIQTATPATTNAPRYAAIVARTHRLRQLIGVTAEISELAYQNPDDTVDPVEEALRLLYELQAGSSTRPPVEHISDVVTRVVEQIERLYETGSDIVGVPTGLVDIDKLLTGLRPGQLIIAAGRPGMGKSSFAGGAALYAALNGYDTLIATIEMTAEEIAARMLSSEGQIDGTVLRTGQLAERDWPRLSTAIAQVSAAHLYTVDAATATLSTLRSDVRRTAQQLRQQGRQLHLVVVDYLQLLLPDKKTGDRRVDVDELAAGLKRLAREFDVPVLAAAQLSRNCEIRRDKRPILADVRESGAIEANADVVIGLYRDEMYNPETDQRNIAELAILKQRNGPTGIVKVAWLDHYTRFANMARQDV